MNPVEVKLGAAEIGKMRGFTKPEWSHRVSMELELEYKKGLFQERVKRETKDYQVHRLSVPRHAMMRQSESKRP